MESSPTQSSNRGAYLFVAGAIFYVAFCYGLIYKISGNILGESGFKGILAGTLIGGFGGIILGAVSLSLAEKASPERRPKILAAGDIALLLISGLLAWFLAIPTLKQEATTYYYGSATTTYEVTYNSGKVEHKSGAELGEDKWDWAAALYLTLCLSTAAIALSSLLRRRFSSTKSL